MGFLDRFRGLWARARPMAALPAPASILAANTMGEALAAAIGSWTLPKRGSWQLLAAYSELPWLHGCVRRRAEALAAVEWVLYRSPGGGRARRLHGMRSSQAIRHRALKSHVKAKTLEQVYEHPILDLLEEPMPLATDIPRIHGSAWWELLSTWMDLVGEAPIGLDGPRTAQGVRIGAPEELCPIIPSWINSVPTEKHPYFELIRPGPIRVEPRDMIWVRHLDPANPYTGRGIGTAIVLADELETDEYMSAAARARFFNGATPDFILGIKRQTGTRPTKEQLAELTRDIENKHQGPDKAGRFHVVGDDFKVEQLGHTLLESQYIDGRKFLRDTCMQVFGVPPEILGVLESSNKSTIAAAGDHFARYSTVPMLERFRVALQTELLPAFGDDLVLDYISPIPADVEDEWRIMIALPAAFTINDVREMAGKAPLSAGGDELYKAPGAIPVAGKPPQDPKTAKPEQDGQEVPDVPSP